MAQSLSKILIHLAFSTKERRPLIDADVERDLHRYLNATCANLGCAAHEVGGVADHVHVFFSLSRTITVARFVEKIKTSSSKWIKTKGERYQPFAWQGGYGAFSISQSDFEACCRYVARQREHHKKMDFKEEFRLLLKRYGIEYDERYVWD